MTEASSDMETGLPTASWTSLANTVMGSTDSVAVQSPLSMGRDPDSCNALVEAIAPFSDVMEQATPATLDLAQDTLDATHFDCDSVGGFGHVGSHSPHGFEDDLRELLLMSLLIPAEWNRVRVLATRFFDYATHAHDIMTEVTAEMHR